MKKKQKFTLPTPIVNWEDAELNAESVTMLPSENVNGLGVVPTILSVCPNCKKGIKWHTTGVLVPITCKNCNTRFNGWKIVNK